MKEASWPIFMAAPFIVPRVSTIRSAASRWRLSICSLARSPDRARLAALVPAYRAPCVPITDPSCAVRRTLLFGIAPSSLPRDPA